MSGGRAALLALLLGASACRRPSPAPPEWRRTLQQMQTWPYGSWVNVYTKAGGGISGELLAVDDEDLTLRVGRRIEKVPRPDVVRVVIAAWESNLGLAGVTAFGALSTISHGFWLVFSAPVWIVTGIGVARVSSSIGHLEVSGMDLEELNKWARWPQGMPRAAAAPAPPPNRGRPGGPCYPNSTCNAGAACQEGRCRKIPELGHEGGRCYARGTCEPGLSCREGRCQSAPPAPDGGVP